MQESIIYKYIKSTEMGGGYSTHGRNERMHTKFGCKIWGRYLEDLGKYGRMLLKWSLKKQGGTIVD
jgi:hypothetical protein